MIYNSSSEHTLSKLTPLQFETFIKNLNQNERQAIIKKHLILVILCSKN